MRNFFLAVLFLLIGCSLAQNCNGTNVGCISCLNGTNDCQECNSSYTLNSTLCSPCNIGQYSPASNSTGCVDCQSNCTQCNATVCFACYPDFQLQNGSCNACALGTFSQGGQAQCQTCPNGCISCSFSSSTNASTCSNCSLNFGPSNGACNPCPQQRYSNGGSSICRPCPANCSSCVGSFVNSTKASCTNCLANYTIVNESCVACPSGQASAGGQTTCCPVGCSACNGSVCLSCQANYIVSNTSCVACARGTSSEGGNATFCVNCTTGCVSCNSTNCISCDIAFTLNTNDTCTLCLIENCTNCSTENYCQNCYGNFSLGIFPSNNKTVCSCNSPFVIINNNCVCPPKLIYNGTTCLCTALYCVACSSADICFLCQAGYVSVGLICSPYCQISNCTTCNNNLQCTTCVSGLSPNSNGTSCVVCNLPNCSSCLTNNICAFCMSGTILSNVNGTPTCLTCNIANCLVCSSNNICYQCAAGYINNNNVSCTLCLSPCSSCSTNGCLSCQPPYYVTPFSNGTCFICNVENCVTCNTTNPSICQACAQFYTLTSSANACQPICQANCINCTSSTVCVSCATYYYVNSSNACSLCNNVPQCLTCTALACTSCASGFYLSNGQCYACAAYCAICSSPTSCETLNPQFSVGFVLVQNGNSTSLANCNPGCSACSNTNPLFCLTCMPGFYIGTMPGVCIPCALASNCMQCSTVNASICITCYPGSVLNINNTCTLCSPSCATCNATNSSQCTSCEYGLVLINGSCSNSTSCGSGCATCTVGSSAVCSLCMSGWVLNSGSCVPCQAGCKVCSNSNFAVCLNCLAGFYVNSTGGCSMCTSYCSSCTSLGCTACQQGYQLTSNFTCLINCLLPCASCQPNSPATCTSCLYGFLYNRVYVSGCGVNNTCNIYSQCTYCPPGTIIATNNTKYTFNQICIECLGECTGCLQNNQSYCTSCYPGYYLSNSSCLSCPAGCFNCTSPSVCFTCSAGYVASIITVNIQPITCIPCQFPCKTCSVFISTCLTCATNYTLQGTQCVTSFNFQIASVLNALPATFNQNYLGYLTAAANAIQANLNAITVLSIVYGSVNVTMLVSSTNEPGSSAAIAQQQNLQTALSGTVAGMQVTSTTISTNGGDNGGGGNDDNTNNNTGLTKTGIIIIAVFAPILSIAIIGGIIMIIYTRKKKIKEVEALELKSMNSDRQSGFSSQKGRKQNLI